MNAFSILLAFNFLEFHDTKLCIRRNEKLSLYPLVIHHHLSEESPLQVRFKSCVTGMIRKAFVWIIVSQVFEWISKEERFYSDCNWSDQNGVVRIWKNCFV
ncbi:hypothetical protein CEXT_651981 [Caerostris extrusa]|uniref:Uncharacterized protein n=1 Tax=Caerostris extrusa TaxID=172846 RepID=A0AAV4WUR6_CAEEX|nr:hypothetical protein CEXT_651981 [Caerostris extrusa]